MGFFTVVKDKIRTHLIVPILKSYDPIPSIAWGTAIGLLVGFTPTVGVQMYIVFMFWLVARTILRKTFSLSIGLAMVWISNPITMIPMYYCFLITGNAFAGTFGYSESAVTYQVFKTRLAEITALEGLWAPFMEGVNFLIMELGLTMMVGSLFYAIPVAIVGFYGVAAYLRKRRSLLAQVEGLTYEEWRIKYETPPPAKKKPVTSSTQS